MEGKRKCEFLKGIRKRMAEANGIPYEPRECTYEGKCTGTCPFCEKEAAEILSKLKDKGDNIIKTDTETIASFEEVVKKYEDYIGPIGYIDISNREKRIDQIKDEIKREQTEREKELTGRMNKNVDKDVIKSHIDPFRGFNNPLVSDKELRAMREERNLHNRESKPLMGDIDEEEWRKYKMEELRKLQEEQMKQIMLEQSKPTMGKLDFYKYDEENKIDISDKLVQI